MTSLPLGRLLISSITILAISACQPEPVPTIQPTAKPRSSLAPTATATAVPSSPTPDVLPTSLTYEEALPYFAIDPTFELDFQENESRDEAGVTIRDVNYASPVSGRTAAYLVVPPGDGLFAGMLYMHWLGGSQNSRDEFLDEAVAMAPRGVVSLLVTGHTPWSTRPTGDVEADRRAVMAQTIELRMALELLLA